MLKKRDHINLLNRGASNQKTNAGYPLYPTGQDIYNKYVRENTLDYEDFSKIKEPKDMDENEMPLENDFFDDVSDSELDVPGSELDDEQERIGSEDEENNYYSIGGDNHDDLEEDRG